MRAFLILKTALLALFVSAGVAHADTRAVYTISGISVDEEGANPREAEYKAFTTARLVGLRRLINKITLPEDREMLGVDFYSAANANAFAAAVDVDNEKRTTTLYRAELSVLYNPNRIRDALKQANIPYMDQQAARSMIAAVSSSNPQIAEEWRRAWPEQDLSALNPYVTALSAYSASDSWPTLASEARAVGASNVVIADLSGTKGDYRVRMVRETPGGATTIGVTNPVATLEEAALAASAYLDATWKRQSIVRDNTARTRSNATVMYSDLRSWNELRQALSGSALVSEFQVKAISAEGAQVSFAFAGDQNRLMSDLRQRGVKIEPGPGGWIITSALRMTR